MSKHIINPSMLITSVLLALLIFLLSMNFGMFWDNVLFASKMGNHLYYNSILDWHMPNSFDPGHPPFLGFLLAICWKIFGHTLWVSHLLMFPFTVGCFYQLQVFTNQFITSKSQLFWGMLFLVFDPTFSATMTLVNPETPIIFFFFLSVNGILKNNNRFKYLGLLFLSIISFRSMMLFGGIFLFELLYTKLITQVKWQQSFSTKKLFMYVLSAVPGLIYVLWRLFTKGWLQTHDNSPWQSLWQTATWEEFLMNCVVLYWRYADFGRIFIIIFLMVSLLFLRKTLWRQKKVKTLILLAKTSVFFIVITVLFSTNAFGHRYFIVSYLSIAMLAFLIITQLAKYKKIIYLLLLAALISGNLWVYPDKISQGWDATLAHVPYHQLRKDAIKYLDQHQIDLKEVGTFFPNYNTIDEIELNGDTRSLQKFDFKNPYVVYSNVFNTDNIEYDFIMNYYREMRRFERCNIYVSILEKR